jgi:hypothetical protein
VLVKKWWAKGSVCMERCKSDTIQLVSLHSEKVGVWCAVSLWRIIGPLFFHETVNSDHYVNDTLNSFFNQLTAEERQHGYFQQADATAHTANATMFAIREVFEDWIIYLFMRCKACLQAEVVSTPVIKYDKFVLSFNSFLINVCMYRNWCEGISERLHSR